MQTLLKSGQRGATSAGWLESRHSFSFGDYFDPQHMGFGPLRVINEDWVRPARGFPMHGHADMEIITVVLKGSLAHEDSLGNGSVIRPGDVQVMSAGSGIRHSEFNPSEDEDVHLLQIWIQPEKRGLAPGYQQATFDADSRRNVWRAVVTPAGEQGSLVIHQDASLYVAQIEEGKTLPLAAHDDRLYWLQVATGEIAFGDKILSAGDALAIDKETVKADIKALASADVLLFDLPR